MLQIPFEELTPARRQPHTLVPPDLLLTTVHSLGPAPSLAPLSLQNNNNLSPESLSGAACHLPLMSLCLLPITHLLCVCLVLQFPEVFVVSTVAQVSAWGSACSAWLQQFPVCLCTTCVLQLQSPNVLSPCLICSCLYYSLHHRFFCTLHHECVTVTLLSDLQHPSHTTCLYQPIRI